MSCILLHKFLCNLENDEDWVVDNNRRDEIADIGEDEVIGIEAERQAGAEWRDQMRQFFLNL